jgi:hypothetical protein
VTNETIRALPITTTTLAIWHLELLLADLAIERARIEAERAELCARLAERVRGGGEHG